MNRKRFQVESLGIEVSTSQVKVAVMSRNGQQDFAAVDMKGDVSFIGCPAFKLDILPVLILGAMDTLEKVGWTFRGTRNVSVAIRQHDMCLLDRDMKLITPAISWQCDRAVNEVGELVAQGAEDTVGKIEARFVLPKLMWLLKKRPELKKRLHRVMTTDGWIAYKLTGNEHWSTSEALSNAILDQKTKKLAKKVIETAGMKLEWFPSHDYPLVRSGGPVGKVKEPGRGMQPWKRLARELVQARYFAGLGDNHASGVGCGLCNFETAVVSFGSSGTVVSMVDPSWRLAGRMACFEFYNNRLLLGMLHRCALWYRDFTDRHFNQSLSLMEIDQAIIRDLKKIRLSRVEEDQISERSGEGADFVDQAASIQASISLEMLLILKTMLEEVVEPDHGQRKIKRVTLTGGLTRSDFIKGIFKKGLGLIDPEIEMHIGLSLGKLSHERAALGALINAAAMGGSVTAVMRDLCPTEPYIGEQDEQYGKLADSFLKPHLSD